MAGAAGAGASAAGAAAAAQIAQAIKASGAIVHVDEGDFMTIVRKAQQQQQYKAMVVFSEPQRWRSRHYQYITSYKGLFFYTKSQMPLPITSDFETVKAKTIWIP